MSLEKFLGVENLRRSDGIIFTISTTLICWAIFKYNWVFNVPMCLGLVYVHSLVYTRVRAYRYAITAMAAVFWGVVSMAIGGIVYFILESLLKTDPGFYFIILFLLLFSASHYMADIRSSKKISWKLYRPKLRL